MNPAEVCWDGVDNDSDGVVDCADPDCQGLQGPGGGICQLPESSCSDGYDNDGDGSSDCADPDCVSDPACSSSENCTDGVDNDGDGFVDCQDADCQSYASCTMYTDECLNGALPLSHCDAGFAPCNANGHCAEYDSDVDGKLNCVCP